MIARGHYGVPDISTLLRCGGGGSLTRLTGGWEWSFFGVGSAGWGPVAGRRAGGRGAAQRDALAVNAVFVGLVRLEKVFVAEFLVAELAVGFRVENLDAAAGADGRRAAGRRGGGRSGTRKREG